MTPRTRLPNRRAHEVMKFFHNSVSYIVGFGRATPSAPVTEVFINCGKSGTDAQTLARDSAVLLSVALQHGTPIGELQRAITRDANGEPSGPIGRLLDIMAETENV
jgi:hypothetical protein